MQKLLYLLYMIKVELIFWYCYMFPNKGTYLNLLCYKDVFGASKYVKARKKIFGKVESRIRKKEQKSIRIVMVDCTEWCTTEIYDYYNSKGIDIAVIIAPFFHGTEESIQKAYSLCREFCESKNLRYIDLYDPADWNCIAARQAEAQGDVFIYTNPWMGSYPEQLKVKNLPLSTITCYVPYGFLLMKAENHQFNQISHNMFTYIFSESETHVKMYDEYCDIGSSHVLFSGYPKMDYYMGTPKVSEQQIWKGLERNTKKIKIIYSPHWNFDGGYATFLDNGLKILEYAETHQDTTSWIYKPHPLLEPELIRKQYMSKEQYEAYVCRWEQLPNARVYMEGDYGDIFVTSDCIINDSISFIAEYMYTHKPMLLLQNKETAYNAFGEECVRNVYICNGKDIDGVAQFIEKIYNGEDNMKAARDKFFDEKLNYFKKNGQLASAYIISEISNRMWGCQDLDMAASMFAEDDRIAGRAVRISEEMTRQFFDTRTQKVLPHRYNYVIYQDSNPGLALERDAYEKEKIGPCLNVNEQSLILDIGCGVGRWGDELAPKLTAGKYVGIDFSEDFIRIARENLDRYRVCEFYQGSFQEADNILKEKGYNTFDTVLINGVLMYINDDDMEKCLAIIDKLTHEGSIIYIKESVGAEQRFTLNHFYSEELGSQYNAIYRSLDEYNSLFQKVYWEHGYEMLRNEATWKQEQENRKETLSWYWLLKKGK